jgi:hypothetical protein
MPFTILSRYQQALARRSQHWSPTTRGLLWTSAAGFIFSMFVSVVFWGGPVSYVYQALRNNSSTIRIKALRVSPIRASGSVRRWSRETRRATSQ